MTQASEVLTSLSSVLPHDAFELKTFITQGDVHDDKVQGSPLRDLTDTGIFVKELERALITKEADLAIHSLKDVPSVRPVELEIASTPDRQSPHDSIIISPQQQQRLQNNETEGELASLKKSLIIGTSSPRRSLQLSLYYPHVSCQSIRGNIDTRLKHLAKKKYDGIVLAEAGLNRLNLTLRRTHIPVDVMTPAPGQGCLALECRKQDKELIYKLKKIHHRPTWLCVKSERLIMTVLESGCKLPFGAYGELVNGFLNLTVFFGNEDNQKWFRQKKSFPLPHELLVNEKRENELFESVSNWAVNLKETAKRKGILKI